MDVVAVADGPRARRVREAPGLVGVEQRERVVQATSGGLVEQLVAVRIKSTVQSPVRQHEVDVRLRVAGPQVRYWCGARRQVPVAARVEQSVRRVQRRHLRLLRRGRHERVGLLLRGHAPLLAGRRVRGRAVDDGVLRGFALAAASPCCSP